MSACSHCGAALAPEATRCAHCGAVLAPVNPKALERFFASVRRVDDRAPVTSMLVAWSILYGVAAAVAGPAWRTRFIICLGLTVVAAIPLYVYGALRWRRARGDLDADALQLIALPPYLRRRAQRKPGSVAELPPAARLAELAERADIIAEKHQASGPSSLAFLAYASSPLWLWLVVWRLF